MRLPASPAFAKGLGRLLLGALVTGLLSACTAAEASVATPEPAAICDANSVLGQVRGLLSDTTHEVHYLTINGQLTLSVWLVEPTLAEDDTVLTADEVTRIAFERGVDVAYQIVTHSPCSRVLFAAVNPMIVDPNYVSWYVDIIPMRALPEDPDVSLAEVISEVQRSGMEIAYFRREFPVVSDQPPDTCTWSDVRSSLDSLLPTGQRNTAAYMISGYQAASNEASHAPQVFVQIQWVGEPQDELTEARLLARIEAIVEDMDCVYPAIDRIEIYVVDVSGALQVFGYVPRSAIYDHANLEEQIILRMLND